MVVEIIIAGAILCLAAVLYRGVNITITVNHKQEVVKADIPTVASIKSMRDALAEELSTEEQQFYDETVSVIGRVNELMYGKKPDKREVK